MRDDEKREYERVLKIGRLELWGRKRRPDDPRAEMGEALRNLGRALMDTPLLRAIDRLNAWLNAWLVKRFEWQRPKKRG